MVTGNACFHDFVEMVNEQGCEALIYENAP
jgi:hypothetical protein